MRAAGTAGGLLRRRQHHTGRNGSRGRRRGAVEVAVGDGAVRIVAGLVLSFAVLTLAGSLW